ncbi:unnamed protein product, partial [Cuscuta campestris]
MAYLHLKVSLGAAINRNGEKSGFK